MRYSRQRQLILDSVKSEAVHPTADLVYKKLKKENPTLSLGTVYRNLNLLAENGDLIRIEVMGDKDHYDGNTEPHFHMVCTNCHKIIDIPFSVASDLNAKVFQVTGDEITAYDIAFKGVCKNCKGEI